MRAFKLVYSFKAEGEKWVSTDTVRATIRSAVEDVTATHQRCKLAGDVEFRRFDARDRKRSRSFSVLLGFVIADDDFADDQEALYEDLRLVSHALWNGLVEQRYADELWLKELLVAGAVVFDNGEDPAEFTFYTKPDKPRPGHLRAL